MNNYGSAVQKQEIRQYLFTNADGSPVFMNEKNEVVSANSAWREYSNAGGQLTFKEWVNMQNAYAGIDGKEIIETVKEKVKDMGNFWVYALVTVGLGLTAYGLYVTYKKD